MRVLLIGHSVTLGLGNERSLRMPAQLNHFLSMATPDEQVEVITEAWRQYSESRIEELADRIRNVRPHYLIIQPVHFWVTQPVVAHAADGTMPLFERALAQVRRRNEWLEHWLFSRGPAWAYIAQQWIVRNSERRFFGAKPLLSVSEALAAVQYLLGVASQLEVTHTILLDEPMHDKQAHLRARNRKLRAIHARLRPDCTQRSGWEFQEGLRLLGQGYARSFLEALNPVVRDEAADKRHAGPEQNRIRAIQLCEEILRLERGEFDSRSRAIMALRGSEHAKQGSPR